ncbi:AraC family transcriptional regulator [Asticcacaulis endophyticus]|uniref:AraC family transcriptional regulator n=1 Tax=Asticcacaulis endophyticus TaxID=1395890 RepID=A0A918Q046_9CAUL|nr:AraC family transcriptional regulator [Asticcacaulis endophyticus]GGZ29072.1 AraC family transcriptional regulator [Asticcacaulis endophyticus]
MTSHIPADRCKLPPAFWRALDRCGLPPVAVLRQARLPATVLGGTQVVSTGQYFAVWRALETLSSEPAFGIRLVQMSDPEGYPPAFLAAYFARDYRDALMRTARFKRLCTPEELYITETEHEVTLTTKWLFAVEPEPAVSTDVAFALLLSIGRHGTGQNLTPVRVELMRPKPQGGAHQAFFGCPVHFGAARNALILKPGDLERPFPGHNPELLEMLTPALSAALGELDASDAIGDQVKAVLKGKLASGRPELAEVARDLGLSERTLQRRITEAETSFRSLLNDARREWGCQLLRDGTSGIDEIAYLLGYQDTRSFCRAFREWEGLPPNQWRKVNSDQPSLADAETAHLDEVVSGSKALR